MTWTPPNVVIVPTTHDDLALATKLAEQSQLTLQSELHKTELHKTELHKTEKRSYNPDSHWRLSVQSQQLSLIRPDGVSVAIDFNNGKAARRTRETNFKNQPLARALGLQKQVKKNNYQHRNDPAVIDATAGLGVDSWMMANLGCRVRLIESSLVLSMMLEQAVQAQHTFPPESNQLSVINADAIDYLNKTDTARADIIYLDPMYPQSRNKALVKKGMQLLHELVGPNNDNPALLQAALQKSDYRVVVKRPKGAPALAGSELWTGQVTQVTSPNTRYDVYHTHNN